MTRPHPWFDKGVQTAGVLLGAYLVGSIPFSFVAARLTRGVDLRRVAAGTVSDSALYRVAGAGPVVVAGILDVAKGAVGPLLAGRDPVLAALAGAAAVVGHNWSPFLRGAGGRGMSPAMGALLVTAWPGTVLLLAGLALGKLAGQTSVGAFLAYLALVPALAVTRGQGGALAGAAVLVPLLAKRLTGNRLPAGPGRRRIYLRRLVFDQDAR